MFLVYSVPLENQESEDPVRFHGLKSTQAAAERYVRLCEYKEHYSDSKRSYRVFDLDTL